MFYRRQRIWKPEPKTSLYHVESTCNKPPRLEQIIVVFRPRFLLEFMGKAFAGFCKASSLVDDGQLLNNVIVKSRISF